MSSLTEEDPPTPDAQCDEKANRTQDEHDDQRLAYCSVELVHGCANPVDPAVVRAACPCTDFPAAQDLAVAFAKYPNPEVYVRV